MQALKKSACSVCRALDPLDYKISEDTILIPTYHLQAFHHSFVFNLGENCSIEAAFTGIWE